MHNLNVLAFENATQAFELRDALDNLQGKSLFSLEDAVVVSRDTAGKIRLHQAEAKAIGCASAGSVVGLIVGLCFLQPWVGSLAGAGVGAGIGALLDFGIDDQFMKDLGATLKPGTAALFLLGSQAKLDKLGEALGPLLRGCTILHTTVNTEREAEIRKLLENQ
jgi:uncharacterized membrane protein